MIFFKDRDCKYNRSVQNTGLGSALLIRTVFAQGLNITFILKDEGIDQPSYGRKAR